MSENKKTSKENTNKATGLAVAKHKAPIKKIPRKSTSITRTRSGNLERVFDETFERFRSDFENLLFPFPSELSDIPDVRVPAVDLEDREKDFLLKVEMPGFKKEDIEINVQEDGVEVSAATGWKYDKKEKSYICKERACETFYRYVDLPEEIKICVVCGQVFFDLAMRARARVA